MYLQDLEVVAYLNWGLARVKATLDGGVERTELWVTGVARKTCRCHLCNQEISAAARVRSWRAINNALYRAVRVCVTCWPPPPTRTPGEKKQ